MTEVAPSARGFLLPDLCSATAVLFLLLISVLLAFTLELFAGSLKAFDWIGLGGRLGLHPVEHARQRGAAVRPAPAHRGLLTS
jgi:hypothetical protein